MAKPRTISAAEYTELFTAKRILADKRKSIEKQERDIKALQIVLFGRACKLTTKHGTTLELATIEVEEKTIVRKAYTYKVVSEK
jgi:hypothetical protein